MIKIIRGAALLFLLGTSLSGFCQQKVNVLFVGNSLTYYNNLPELVKLVARCDSVEFTYTSLTQPNYALFDHWNDGIVIREIQTGKYQFVVVQQGPLSQPEGRKWLLEYGMKFDSLCDQHNTQLAAFMVWPAKQRLSDFPGVYRVIQTFS